MSECITRFGTYTLQVFESEDQKIALANLKLPNRTGIIDLVQMFSLSCQTCPVRNCTNKGKEHPYDRSDRPTIWRGGPNAETNLEKDLLVANCHPVNITNTK